jgi:transcriptional regulator with XRE-family HTH domain
MAEYGVKGARQLRQEAGKKQIEICSLSGLGVATVRKIENGEPVGETSAWALFNALNKLHNDKLARGRVYHIGGE